MFMVTVPGHSKIGQRISQRKDKRRRKAPLLCDKIDPSPALIPEDPTKRIRRNSVKVVDGPTSSLLVPDGHFTGSTGMFAVRHESQE